MSTLNPISEHNQSVVYMITSLAMGGAQKVLLGLLSSSPKIGEDAPLVISLLRTKGLEADFERVGAKIFYVDLEKPWLLLKRLAELRGLLAKSQTRIIYSSLHHANLFAVLLAKFVKAPSPAIIWGLHDTPLKNLYTRWQHRFLFWLSVRLAVLPKKIVLVSERSRKRYLEVGYPAKSMVLIPNGVETLPLDIQAMQQARDAVRQELNLSKGALLIGSLTRAVPEKDLPTMLAAFAQLLRETKTSVHLVLVGEGIDSKNLELQALIEQFDLQGHIHLLGLRHDPKRLIQAFDIATLSSRSEALPLFIAEAMALGIPCVATDVGDIGLVFAGHGVLVPAAQPDALANAWRDVLDWSETMRLQKIEAAWQHIYAHYSLEQMQKRHAELFNEVLADQESNQAWNIKIHHKRC